MHNAAFIAQIVHGCSSQTRWQNEQATTENEQATPENEQATTENEQATTDCVRITITAGPGFIATTTWADSIAYTISERDRCDN